ncbi:MAG TPA: DUF2339 domain-containing protein [Polyangiaceae bacterium]|nr:DUF2339 domain-containing protein [Polyangiaceae bacterium]
MEELLVLVGLAIGGFFFVAPIVALTMALGARRQAREAALELQELRSRLIALEQGRPLPSGALVRTPVAPAESRRRPPTLVAEGDEDPDEDKDEITTVDAVAEAVARSPGVPTPTSPTTPDDLSSADEVEPTVVEPSAPTSPNDFTLSDESQSSRSDEPESDESADASNDSPDEPDEPDDSDASAAPAPAPAPAPVASPNPSPSAAELAAASSGLDWENLIGVRLFAWLGGAALFLSAVFFLQYSIQHGLLSPPLRVAMGLVFGTAALLLGDRARSRALLASEALSGAGIGILYAALFSARSLYHLIDSTTAFFGMVLVTAVAAVLSARRGSFLVALFGLLGGMLTPYLVSTGEDRPLALLGYVLLLDVGFLAVAHRRGWHVLGLVGLVCSTILFGGWAHRYLTGERVPWALLALALVAGIYVACSQWWARRAQTGESAEGVAKEPSATVQGLVVLGALVPLAATMAFAGQEALDVSPWFLGAYLTVLVLGAALLAERSLGVLFPAAVLLAMAACAGRIHSDSLWSTRPLDLLALALPLAGSGAWTLWQGRRGPPSALRDAALGVATLGALLVLSRVVDVEYNREPITALLVFAALPSLLAVARSAQAGRGEGLALGLGALFVAMAILVVRYSEYRVSEFAVAFVVLGLGSWALALGPKRYGGDRWALVTTALILPLYFGLAYLTLKDDVSAGPLGALAIVAALLSLIAWRVLANRQPGGLDDASVVTFAGISLGFLSLALPILVGSEWLTIGWALELFALAWLYRRIPHRHLPLAIWALWGLVSVRLFFNGAIWEYHPRSGTPIFNFYLYLFGVPVVAYLFAARYLGNEETTAKLRMALRVGALGLAFFLLNIQVADCFSSGETLTFHLTDGSLAEDMTYSLAWGAFALVLLGVGVARQVLGLRVAALLVLTLTLLKVTLHDLWALGGLYRVGSLIGVAVALLLVSFLTQRLVLKRPTTETQ